MGITGRDEPHRFFRFAFRAKLPVDRRQRNDAFKAVNMRFAPLDQWAGHAERVGVDQAVGDYICGLVEAGVIPYRERYQGRY